MSRIKARLSHFMPVLVIIGIVNAMLCAIEGISGSFNPYLSVIFFVLNLIGARQIWLIWRKNRQQQISNSLPTNSDVQ